MPIVKAFIGSDDVSERLVGLDATPSGPGVVGAATLHLDQEGGGLDLRFGEEVKVYRTFDDAGAGVADHGRLFGGIVANRDTGYIRNIKTWTIQCQSYNLLLARIVRDKATSVTLTADTFVNQIASLVQTVQRSGNPSVNKPIDTSEVAALHASMPAVTLEGGHSLGWYIMRLCHTVHELTPSVFPAFFLNPADSFGVGEIFGTATLYIYDASLVPSPLYEYHPNPTGAQRQIHGTFTRRLEGAGVVNRRQIVFGNVVATHAETASGTTYPNAWQNQLVDTDKGYWGNEPLSDNDLHGWDSAIATIRADVQKTAYPRETIEFDVAEHLLPGDVVTVINDLEAISANYRVTEAKWDWSADAVTPWMHIRLGARLLRLGEEGEEIPFPPTEGDVTPPSIPTWAAGTAWIIQNEQVIDDPLITVEAQLTLTEPGDMGYYIWRYAYTHSPTDDDWEYARTEATFKNLELLAQPELTPMTFQVQAFDTTGNGSGWSTQAKLTTAGIRFFPAPPNMSFETADPSDSTKLYGWTLTALGTSEAKRYGLDRVDGRNCLRFKHDGSNSPLAKSGLFPVQDDTSVTYYWTFWAKGSQAGDTIVPRVYWHDADGVETGNTPATTVTLTTSWAMYTRAIASPGTGARWGALFFTAGGLGTNQFGYIDAMTFSTQLPGEIKGTQLEAGAVTAAKLGLDYLAVSANTTLDSTHFAVGVDASGAARTITLPDAAGLERIYAIKKTDSSANAVTIDGDGSDTIDGATTYVLYRQHQSVLIQADGTNWRVLASHGSNLHHTDYASTSYTTNPEPTSNTTVKRNDGSTDMSVAFTLDATRKVKIGFFARLDKAAGWSRMEVRDGATVIFPDNAGGSTAVWTVRVDTDDIQHYHFEFEQSLASGSHTIKVYHQASYDTAAVEWWDRYLWAEILDN